MLTYLFLISISSHLVFVACIAQTHLYNTLSFVLQARDTPSVFIQSLFIHGFFQLQHILKT